MRAVSEREWDYDTGKYNIAADQFIYYPETRVAVDYKPGEKEYYVEIVPERPDITVEVTVKDEAGGPIEGLPVGIWAGQERHYFWRRKLVTDAEGKCAITQVPHEGVLLKLDGDALGYKNMMVPVELVPGKKEYNVEVTLESERERDNK
jgi:hypothetical protein